MTAIQDQNPSAVTSQKQTITSLFLRQVEKQPEAAAVIDDLAMLTYRQLADRMKGLAGIILDKTGRDEARICILASQQISAVAALLGVLKAGKCFVPMLPQDSDDYLRFLWKNSEASLIVCEEQEAFRAARICGNPDLVISCDSIAQPSALAGLTEASENPNSISAIMYTSGSTGQPKGVMTTGQAILDRATQNAEMANVTAADRQASVVPWQFAASFPDIFAPLMTGASIFLYDNHRQGIDRLAPWIKKNAITLLKLPSALVRRFIDSASADLLASIRYVYISGGSMKAEEARSLLAILPTMSVLMHGFGSTETNLLACRDWRQNDPLLKALAAEDTLPAGYPVSGKKIQILDDEGRLAAPGAEGELVAVSLQLFAGYWKQPEMTAQCLKELPDGERAYHTGDLARIRKDGCLEITGRKGHRVKIRGLRIDLEAVESLLRSLPYIRDAAAIEFSSSRRESQLVAYLETGEDEDNPVTATRIRENLKKAAAGYMIPSRFVMMETLPRTASGKINRSALPAPGNARPALANPYVPPRNDLENLLADIWADVLDISDVGIHDPFMELGGDSLLALELEMRLHHELDIDKPINMLLQSATIAQMSQWLQNPSDSPKAAISASLSLTQYIRMILRGIKRKFIDRSAQLAIVSPSYESFLRFHQHWLSLAPVRFLYRNKIRVFRQWLALTDQMDQAKLLSTRNLMINTWFVGREFFMAQQAVFDRWTIIKGEAHLKRAAEAGRGAIIVFPHTRAFFPSVRKRIVSKIFPESYFLNVNDMPWDDTLRTILVAERLKEARDVLKRGGAVWVAGDGQTGKIRKVLTRYGRRFPFRAGAADLAAKTGASLILGFPDLRADGTIEVEFLKPLDPGSLPSQSMRADYLLQQYAEIYVDRWPRLLPNMTALWQRLRLADTSEEKT
ncbi:MAG: AMP-binding protein [Smithellaceae bacterium]